MRPRPKPRWGAEGAANSEMLHAWRASFALAGQGGALRPGVAEFGELWAARPAAPAQGAPHARGSRIAVLRPAAYFRKGLLAKMRNRRRPPLEFRKQKFA